MPTTFFGQLFSPRMLVAFLMGFACGVPLLLTGSVLQAWMTEEGVDLTVIGLYSLVGLPYTLKFLWAPVFDRFTLPLFGRRRGWMLVTQVCLIVGLIGLGLSAMILYVLEPILSMPLSISPQVSLIAVGFSVLIGVVFGLYPANKASKLRPIEALILLPNINSSIIHKEVI